MSRSDRGAWFEMQKLFSMFHSQVALDHEMDVTGAPSDRRQVRDRHLYQQGSLALSFARVGLYWQ